VCSAKFFKKLAFSRGKTQHDPQTSVPNNWYVTLKENGGDGSVSYRHSNRANTLMSDGHVESLPRKAVPDIAWKQTIHPTRGTSNPWLFE
jgi:prepilin-type processing-associated H-X9-DG protein